MSATTTLVGNATADVELRYSQAGKPVANITIAVSDRKKNQQTGEWEDGDTWFARCTIFGSMAETVAGSITKGMRVIATGRIKQDSWKDKDGNPRTSVGVIVDEIGPSLRYATAQVTRAASGGGNNAPAAPAPSDEPWTTPGASYGDDTPF
ncbi:single-stranded DNA-binding protein [Microbacterium plantarum]|uniref:single-stranded DNA-binding protein n=1 Tax=Microbacterium plantarum TaxID=1816425 RepID=UPI002B46A36A|nr:single-stranded DNA-binding protein [Microbacterium plantarum]WRK16519.1 single-stranded DNA-binding protein [Microbacterium plantarum]